jgi:hypothetical protein
MIQIIFEFNTEYGVFRDALHLPEDHGYSDADLEAIKQERLANWISIVKPQPPIDEVI